MAARHSVQNRAQLTETTSRFQFDTQEIKMHHLKHAIHVVHFLHKVGFFEKLGKTFR